MCFILSYALKVMQYLELLFLKTNLYIRVIAAHTPANYPNFFVVCDHRMVSGIAGNKDNVFTIGKPLHMTNILHGFIHSSFPEVLPEGLLRGLNGARPLHRQAMQVLTEFFLQP